MWLVAWVSMAFAVDFLEPASVPAGKGVVVLTSGETLEGKVRTHHRGANALGAVTVKGQDGKRRFEAAEVASIEVTPAWLYRVMAGRGADSGDISDPKAKRQVVYEQNRLPNGDVALLQLVNPSFASTVKVYANPSLLARKSSSVSIGGAPVKKGEVAGSYYVRSADEGEGVVKVERPRYREQVLPVFRSACPGYDMPTDDEWLEFADHVRLLHDDCGIE